MKIALYSLYLFLPFAVACSTSTPPASVELPSQLSIASIAVAGTGPENRWTAQDPIQPKLGCGNAPLIVTVTPELIDSVIDNFTLAVPGSCGTTVSCGWLKLRVDPGNANEIDIATWMTVIPVDDAITAGSHTFRIELHDENDNVLLNGSGTPVGDQVEVEFLQPDACPVSNGDAG